MKKRDVQVLASKVDNLGVLAFLFVIIYASLSLSKSYDLMTLILLLVGIGGFCVDSFIVLQERFFS